MKKTKIIGSLILTVLLLMLQVPLDSALFNLGSYMSAFGISLDWLIQHQSMIKVIISIIAVGVLIAILFDKEENQEHHGTTINQSQKVLFGNNNTQNLNIGIEQRKVTKELIGQMPLLKKIEKKKFRIVCIANDPEAFSFSSEVKELFIKHGFEYEGMVSSTGLVGGDGRIVIQSHDDGIDILVGMNTKTETPLRDMGGLMTGLGKI
jgi:hypothetical protein